MRKLLIRILCAIATFSISVGIHKTLRSSAVPTASVEEVRNPPKPEPAALPSTDDWTSFDDLLTDAESMEYNGYLIERRYKSVQSHERLTEDQGYVVLLKDHKVIRSFDGMAYHPLGNITEFGFFAFLGTNEKQVAISQDTPRGGVQWIVDLTPTPRVIFDGVAWGLGREAADCEIEDLDGDGIFEISLPITDFYSFMDKMAVAAIPLPMITFKYDPAKKTYVPITHLLSEPNKIAEPDRSAKSDEHFVRGEILEHMLELIYQGKRDPGWQYFNRTYNLSDKKEIEQRVKKILSHQPIYKYIYKNKQTH